MATKISTEDWIEELKSISVLERFDPLGEFKDRDAFQLLDPVLG